MSNVTIKMRDGTTRQFIERGRPGGSYSNSVSYETGFVVVTDEWGKRTAIPAADILEVETAAYRTW
jgi:hypothetical protein